MSRKTTMIVAGALTAAVAGTAAIAYRRRKNGTSRSGGEFDEPHGVIATGVDSAAAFPKATPDTPDVKPHLSRKAKKRLAGSAGKR